jgi:DeoR family glycerol-3-phosphate regulon repressor
MTSPRSDAWAPNPRQQSLLEEVRARGAVSVERLAQRLDVTMQTVRRDIQRLSEAGLLSRFHGGVSLPMTPTGKPASPALAWQERQALRADAKARLARSVAAAIPDGATLFLGIGTTVEAVALALSARKNLTVHTHSLHVAQVLANNAECQVHLPAGQLRRRDSALEGAETADTLRRVKADIAILSALGINEQGQLLDRDERELPVLQAVLGQVRQTWLVVDASKFMQAQPTVVSHLSDMHRVFTEALPPTPLPALMHEWGVGLTIAP